MSMYTILADAILAIHVAFVAFVVVALPVVLLGWLCGWSWVRNFWFRLAHVSAIGIVVAESWAGVTCPLTDWEDGLRKAAGQSVQDGTFIGRWLQAILFYEFEPWQFTLGYTLFGALVLATFLLAPPRLPRKRAVEPEAQPEESVTAPA